MYNEAGQLILTELKTEVNDVLMPRLAKDFQQWDRQFSQMFNTMLAQNSSGQERDRLRNSVANRGQAGTQQLQEEIRHEVSWLDEMWRTSTSVSQALDDDAFLNDDFNDPDRQDSDETDSDSDSYRESEESGDDEN